MREIDMLVVHCTASPDSADNIDIDDVRLWHMNDNKWSDVGYHWLIIKQGVSQHGRPEERQGAGAKGYNKKSIHICWVGMYDCHTLQYATLLIQSVEIVIKYNIPIENVVGHCELPGVTKTCPNLNMTKFRNGIQQIIKEYAHG